VLDAAQLFLAVHRADVGVLVHRVADAERGEADLEFLGDFLDDRFLNKETRAGAADFALVEVDAVDDALDGLVDGGVLEDDVGRFAAEFEGEALELAVGARSGGGLGDALADFGGAGEGDLVDERMLDERLAGAAPALGIPARLVA
jgi:hypothetical protein